VRADAGSFGSQGGPARQVCAVVLSAGEGTRLRPITATMPKPLCQVGNVALLDRALHRLAAHDLAGPRVVAVNTSYLADLVVGQVRGRAHVSREPAPALGTSGALYQLRAWIAGRPVLAMNSDAYLSGRGRDLEPLLDGWDGQTVRVLTVPPGDGAAEFTQGAPVRFAGVSLLPSDLVATIPPGHSQLVATIWRPAERMGRLETIPYEGVYLDTGTPGDYLAANLHAAAGGSLVHPDAVVTGRVERSVVGAGARVAGSVTRCVVLPGASVAAGEDLADAIRLGADTTVHCRQ
jgi:NDP-sugar pyrophosphorylase family protein